ncbi:MAG: hypothetical protein EHM36_03030, partial [Deltaproteobacteria bacterium]
MNVVVISRNDPHSEFARLRASKKVSYLGWEEIRFTLGETREALRVSGRRSLSADTIRRLHETTAGWIAGLVLLMEKMKTDTGTEPALKEMEVTREGIFDYFATEVFKKAGKEMQAFLVKTALLPQVTPNMAETLTGIGRAEKILWGMDRSHFFITSHSG